MQRRLYPRASCTVLLILTAAFRCHHHLSTAPQLKAITAEFAEAESQIEALGRDLRAQQAAASDLTNEVNRLSAALRAGEAVRTVPPQTLP